MARKRSLLRSIVLLMGLGAAASVLWLAGPHGDPRTTDPGSLEVDIASPRGDVRALHSIDVVFSGPMVPLGAKGREKIKAPLVLDPPLPGSYSWIGTRALSFVPDSPVPAGTRVVCRVPARTTSLEGRSLATDYVWEIVVGRPRLVRSIPANGGMSAPDEPLYLLFNAVPAPSAPDSIRLIGPSGPIRLRAVAVDSMAMKEFFRRGERAEPARILALRPEARIAAGRRYTLSIPAALPFLSSPEGMREPVTIEFVSFGPPIPLSVHADLHGLTLGLAGPVDPEELQSHLTIEPGSRPLQVRPIPGSRFGGSGGPGTPEATYRVNVDLKPGTSYMLGIRAGLTTLLGESLTSDASMQFAVPHLGDELRIVPAGGYLPSSPEPSIRITGTNVDTVEVYGAWVAPDSVDERLVGARQLAKARLPLLARWLEPRETPDSSRAVHIPLKKLGAPRDPGRVVQIRVRARPLYPSPLRKKEVLRDDALIQVTDLGLSIMSGEHPGIAWVTALSTGKPVPAAEVQIRIPGASVYSWSGRTDSEGLVWLPPIGDLQLSAGTPLIAQVRAGKDAAWIELSRYGWNSWRETGSEGKERAFAFIDRPLYRPGEVVHWITHVRRADHQGLAPASTGGIFYSIRRPDGRIADRGQIPLASPGGGNGSYNIPTNAPLGDYAIAFSKSADADAPEVGWTYFQVQEFRLPRFEARLEKPSGYAVSGTTTYVEGRFSYLGGGPLARAPVRWTLSRHTYWSQPKEFGDFSFNDERPRRFEDDYEWQGMTRLASGEGALDEDGRTALPIIPDLTGLSEDQVYVLEMGARDLADRSAYDVVSFPALRAAVRVGARAVFDPERKDETILFSAVVLDSADHPIEGGEIRWRIEKREWKTVRIRRIGAVFGYENVPHDTVLEEGKFQSAREPVPLRYHPSSPGPYAFVVETSDARGRLTRARETIYVSGHEAASWYRDDTGWLELKPDKKNYSPGDTALVLLPGPAVPTEGLVLVLDDGVQRAVRVSRIEGSPRIPLPLSGFAPSGPTVHAVLVGPTLVPQGPDGKRRLPYHGWGAAHLAIRDDDWRLQVNVLTDRSVYEPGDEVVVLLDLKDAWKQPVEGVVALAVVDDAIFELVPPDDPDPVATFFASRGTGVDYDDVRFRLSLAPRGEKGALTPGGDGGAGGLGLRKRFTPTAHWDPAVSVGPDGKATVRFRLADDLTRYRFRALASSGVDRFGYGESKADVRKPIQIEWGAPRFVREGDRIEIAAAVRSHLDSKIGVKLRAEADGALIEGGRDRKLKIDPHGGARATFKVRDPGINGVRLRLSAVGADHEDGVEIEIPTDRPLLWEREFFSGRADPVSRVLIETEDEPLPELGGLTTIASVSMLGGLSNAMDYAIDYPYGCLEQISSTLLALVTQRQVRDRFGGETEDERKDREGKIAAAVQGISQCADDWGLRSWPSPDCPEASDYVAGYVLYAATRARASHADFPRPLWEGLAREVESRLQRLLAPSGDEKVDVNRYLREGPWLVWALSEADRLLPPDSVLVSPDMLENLYARRTNAPIESRLVLGLALANASGRSGEEGLRKSWPNIAANLIGDVTAQALQRTGRHVWLRSSDPGWGDGIGSDVRSTALFLRLLSSVDPSNQDNAGLIFWLLDHREGRSGAWGNQHMTALTLDLFVSTVVQLEGPQSEVSGKISVGPEFQSFNFTSRRSDAIRAFTPLSKLVEPSGETATTQLRVETDGRRSVYFSASLDRARPALGSPPREEGLILHRAYVDSRGARLDGGIPLGDPLFVHLSLVVSRDCRALVVEDALPGGVEALNLTFRNAPGISMSETPETGGEGTDLPIVHSELRDRIVRLFAENVRAGVYHVYYPAIATVAGEFGMPGARMEFLYSPEIYATSGSTTVRVLRGEE